MKIVILTHSENLGVKSINRFTNMLSDGFNDKGHQVEVLRPKAVFVKISIFGLFLKWLQYIDTLLVFPFQLKKKLKNYSEDTLFVLTDNALGPWMKVLKKRATVVHCHDFLAYFSSIGQIPENPTSKSGKIYQNLIKNGVLHANSFISVSNKTKNDLSLILPNEPKVSEVVYNGINPIFKSENKTLSRSFVSKLCNRNLEDGYLLNIGVNVWYKNKLGLIKIYNAWRTECKGFLPLILIGPPLDESVLNAIKDSPYSRDIIQLENLKDLDIVKCYSGANVMIFPSLFEGFGWPIAEAMACACHVVTTNEAPMNEVGGSHAFYIDKMPNESSAQDKWAIAAADVVNEVIYLTDLDNKNRIENAMNYVEKFNQVNAINRIEEIYLQVLDNHLKSNKNTIN